MRPLQVGFLLKVRQRPLKLAQHLGGTSQYLVAVDSVAEVAVDLFDQVGHSVGIGGDAWHVGHGPDATPTPLTHRYPDSEAVA